MKKDALEKIQKEFENAQDHFDDLTDTVQVNSFDMQAQIIYIKQKLKFITSSLQEFIEHQST